MPVVGQLLVHPSLLRTGRVGADGGRVDERLHTRGGGGREHALAAQDVRGVDLGAVASGLDQPGEVNHDVGATEDRPERGGGHVGGTPFGLGKGGVRDPSHEPYDRVHGRLVGEAAQHARTQVAAGTGDHYAHGPPGTRACAVFKTARAPASISAHGCTPRARPRARARWIHLRAPFDATLVDFRTLVVLPALYPIVAVAGAGARRLLDRQAEAESALGEQERMLATQAERERLARDMHDSLAKTVHGIGFSALALSRRISVDPDGAVDDALKLAADARTAAPGGARAAQRPARPRRRRAAAADRDPLRGGALGRADGRRGRRLAGRRRAAAVAGAARAALDPQGGARQRRALRPRVTRRRAPAPARRPRGADVADDGEGFEAPDDLDEPGRRRVLRPRRACASARAWRAVT